MTNTGVLPLGKTNTMPQCRLGANWIETSFAAKDLLVLKDKFSLNQQFVPEQREPSVYQASLVKMHPTGSGSVILLLYSAMRPHVK